jgi:hypothetical protein
VGKVVRPEWFEQRSFCSLSNILSASAARVPLMFSIPESV